MTEPAFTPSATTAKAGVSCGSTPGPWRQTPASAGVTFPLILLARLWQLGPSRLIPPTCRYSPSCSAYAIEAWRTHGALRGSWLALRRLGRCHPWGGCGADPVPAPVPSRS